MTKKRRSLRLKGYDYSQAGAYFLTICTQNRECLFGDIVDGEMILNDAGRMAKSVWDEIHRYYAGIGIDAFQLMANHIHGIILITSQTPVGAGPRARPAVGQPQGVAPTRDLSLPEVVHRFKTMTAKRYVEGVKQHGWRPFEGRLWQRNYWEHVIRNENELNSVREYIVGNPAQWNSDRENPDAVAAVHHPHSMNVTPWEVDPGKNR